MSAGYPTLKSAIDGRVNISTAQRIGSERTNGGHGANCVAEAGELRHDVYGRPASQNTLDLSNSDCSKYTEFNVRRRIATESIERPYVPVCRVGRPGDGMAVGRDVNPRDIYGGTDCGRGNFFREYSSPNNAPPSQFVPPLKNTHYPYVYGASGSYSMDATQRVLRL